MKIEIPLQSETLTDAELAEITGAQTPGKQIEWLKINNWPFRLSRARKPVVGRMFVRLSLCGIDPKAALTSTGWTPDFAQLQQHHH